MDDWRVGFYEAIRVLLTKDKYQGKFFEDVFVTGVDQDEPSPYYCETCGPDPVTVTIYWEKPDGQTGNFLWYGDLGELISQL